MRGDSALLDIASSVADGEAVDWSAVSALATDERERALISRLKIIASIGDVHRSTDDVEAPPADGASTLDVRGRVVGHIRPAVVADAGAPTPSPAPEIGDPASTGVRWGRLLLQERVGAGVYGEVYRAFDESLRRDVAVKLLRASGRSAELLAAKVLNEGRLLARVRHRNVVTVHGVDTHDGRVGLWMEFIRGNTLEQLLERQGPFGGREASLLGQDLCRALAAVHAAGLVHRDVKAQNVIREEGGRLVLMDFGTGLLLEDDEAVKASPVAGTPLYLVAGSARRRRRLAAERHLQSRRPPLPPRHRLVSLRRAVADRTAADARSRRAQAPPRPAAGSVGRLRPRRRALPRVRSDRAVRERRRHAARPHPRPRPRERPHGAGDAGGDRGRHRCGAARIEHALVDRHGRPPGGPRVALEGVAAAVDCRRARRGRRRVADPPLVVGRRIAGRARAAGVARRRAVRSGLVGRSRARRRHRRGRHGAGPAAARRPRRRRSRPPPRRRHRRPRRC